MTAVTLALRDLASGRHLGAAVVCCESRYCSVLSSDAGRIDRRFVPASVWPYLERELSELASGPVPASSALSRVLTPESASDVTIVFVSAQPVNDSPTSIATQLDALLRSFAPHRLRQLQIREGEDA